MRIIRYTQVKQIGERAQNARKKNFIINICVHTQHTALKIEHLEHQTDHEKYVLDSINGIYIYFNIILYT